MPRGKNLLRCINPSLHSSLSRSVIQIKGGTLRDPHKEVPWVKLRQQCWESPDIYRVAIIALHTASLDFSSSTHNLWFGWLTNLGHPLKQTHTHTHHLLLCSRKGFYHQSANGRTIKICYSSKLRLKRSIKTAGICPCLTCTDEESSHLAFSAASRTLWSAMLSLVKSTPVYKVKTLMLVLMRW